MCERTPAARRKRREKRGGTTLRAAREERVLATNTERSGDWVYSMGLERGRLTGSESLRSPTDLDWSSHRKRHSRSPLAFVRLPVVVTILLLRNVDTLLNKQYSQTSPTEKKFDWDALKK